MGGMTQMRKQAPARKSGMKMRMAASPRRSVVRSVKLSNAKLGLVKENEVVRAKKSGVEVAVKTAGVAMPAAVLSVAATAAASHAAELNELAAVATIENPLLPFFYFGGLFGVLGGTIAIYVFLVKIELI